MYVFLFLPSQIVETRNNDVIVGAEIKIPNKRTGALSVASRVNKNVAGITLINAASSVMTHGRNATEKLLMIRIVATKIVIKIAIDVETRQEAMYQYLEAGVLLQLVPLGAQRSTSKEG